MKKITLSVLAAGLVTVSVSAYAASSTGGAPFQVSVPNLKPGASVTLEGLYVQPVAANLAYGSTADSTVSNFSSEYLSPDYDFGFGIGLGYRFPRSGNDVQVKWQHFDHTSTDSGELYSYSTYTKLYDVYPRATFKFDTIDLDIGQYINFGAHFTTRLFAGLHYLKLKEDLEIDRIPQDTSQITNYNDVYNNDFEGVGPRLGVDAVYHVDNCFGVVSHVGTAVLVGHAKTNVYSTETQAGGASDEGTRNLDNSVRVVPAIDVRLGFDYTTSFKNQAGSTMAIEAGYQVNQYIGVMNRIAYGNWRNESSVGFNGPYLSLKFSM